MGQAWKMWEVEVGLGKASIVLSGSLDRILQTMRRPCVFRRPVLWSDVI